MSLLKKFLGDIQARYLGLGGAAGDASNILSVRGPGSLFDGDTAGHQIRINKDAVGDTASFVFQTGFSGRAEFGTIGNDDFEIKVSANGSTFTQAWVIDGTTGVTDFKEQPTYDGNQLWSAGDFTISDYMPKAGGTFTGQVVFDHNDYNNHIQLTRQSEDWSITPSTDGSLNVIRNGGTGQAVFELTSGVDLTLIDGQINGDGAGITGVLQLNPPGEQVITVADTVGDTGFEAIYLDYNVSGADVLTADRNHRALYIDVNSTASGGDTSNEHRLYGADVRVIASGDSDLVYGLYSRGLVSHSAGTVTSIYGVQGIAQADMTGGAASNAYGGFFQAIVDAASGALNNAYGLYGKADLTANYADNLTNAIGVRAEVETDSANTITTATAVQAVIDRNAGTITTGYLFHGNYEGTLPSTAWGFYIADAVPNYLAGDLRVDGDYTILAGDTHSFRVDGTERAQVNDHGLGVGGAAADATNAFAFYGTNLLLNSGGSIDMKYNKNATGDDASMTFQTAFSTKVLMGLLGNDDFSIKVGSSFTEAVRIDETSGRVSLPQTPELLEFTENVSGSFLLDPNEICGWGVRGPVDDALTTDLGNSQATNPARTAGGYMYPFDVKVKAFRAFHRNSNAVAEAWGWVIFSQNKAATTSSGSNTRTSTIWLNEVTDNAGVGPRNYLNNTNQLTDIDLTSLNIVVPAGDILGIGVDAPTANDTNYYVDVMAGYFLLERV